jgi:hypothetical protein
VVKFEVGSLEILSQLFILKKDLVNCPVQMLYFFAVGILHLLDVVGIGL